MERLKHYWALQPYPLVCDSLSHAANVLILVWFSGSGLMYVCWRADWSTWCFRSPTTPTHITRTPRVTTDFCVFVLWVHALREFTAFQRRRLDTSLDVVEGEAVVSARVMCDVLRVKVAQFMTRSQWNKEPSGWFERLRTD
jgi:hypothetical protein